MGKNSRSTGQPRCDETVGSGTEKRRWRNEVDSMHDRSLPLFDGALMLDGKQTAHQSRLVGVIVLVWRLLAGH